MIVTIKLEHLVSLVNAAREAQEVHVDSQEGDSWTQSLVELTVAIGVADTIIEYAKKEVK